MKWWLPWERRYVGNERIVTDERRKGRIDAIRHGTDPSAGATTIYGIALSDMNDEEIRVAAYWLASRQNANTIREQFERECG